MQEAQGSALRERFTIEAKLGGGASGSVYRAYDRMRGTTVAIKVLERVDADALLRFKGEFRQIARIAHPNLLQLHDLTAFGSQWVLSMELIEGCDLLTYLRPSTGAGDDVVEMDSLDSAMTQMAPDLEPPANDVYRGAAIARSLPPPSGGSHRLVDLERLRAVFRQLCEGLRALHKTQRLHRDLKPANVLVVAESGRVVICDFGLVVKKTEGEALVDLPQGQRDTYDDRSIAGTPAYMSPEQMDGRELTTASDWYAVGLMLYQTLTGRLPFDPKLPWSALAAARRESMPLHPCVLVPELPSVLAELALALISPIPSQRPGYKEIITAIEGAARASLPAEESARLIGRDAELGALRSAFARACSGTAALVLVSGKSGMGKSALLQTFFEEVRAQRDALLLTGRCYEREDLPYKAIDPLMDALSTCLLSDGDVVMDDMSGLGALAQMFPVLLRVPTIATTAAQSGDASRDPVEQKRLAFGALRNLCRRLVQRGPLVLCIDDLQWGDLDSAPALLGLLREPHAPALLMLCAFRSEDEERSPLLKVLHEAQLRRSGIVEPVRVSVGALSPAASRDFANELLAGFQDADEAIEHIAEEAAGSPFFLRELAAYVRGRGLASAQQLRLEAVIGARLATLSSDSRKLLSTIVIAGRPERRRVIDSASGLGLQSAAAYRALEGLHFIQSVGTHDRVEPYHDRIRETVYRLLGDDERRVLHRALATALEAEGDEVADPDVLLEHHRAAGDRERAAVYALRAAERAEGLLAFERAAHLYALAMSLSSKPAAEQGALEERLAFALMYAGRGPAAADAFFRAIPSATAEHATVLRGLATAQLLRSGLVGRAFEELTRAQHLLGMPAPTTPLKAIFMLLLRRLRIRLGWLGRRTSRHTITDDERHRMDLLWSIAGALSPIDQLRGGVYQAEHMLLALRARDPYRLARAYAIESSTYATSNRHPEKTQRMLDRALVVGGASREPHALSVALGLSGVCRLLEGRFLESIRLAQQTHVIVSERLKGSFAWDRVANLHFELRATALAGRVGEVVARVPDLVRDAETRGDLYAAVSLRTSHCCWAWLGPDQPDAAREQVALAEKQWAQSGYHLQHWYTTQAIGSIALYVGNVDEARSRLAREWRSTFLIRKKIQFTRTEIVYLWSRLELAYACATQDRKNLEQVRKQARALLRERPPWIIAHGGLLLACADTFESPTRAAQMFYELEGQFEAVDMKLHAAVCGFRRGQLLGAAGGEVLAQASSAIHALGVVRPAGFAALLAPCMTSLAKA